MITDKFLLAEMLLIIIFIIFYELYLHYMFVMSLFLVEQFSFYYC